jgi:uncharacterized Zn finger protein
MGYGGFWAPYVPKHERRALAQKYLEKLRREGLRVQPVEIAGRKIASTFWGEAWCRHLEAFSDFANRLPRGRTYVRNGSVCHLAIEEGEVTAVVSGSEPYDVSVSIVTLPKAKWSGLKGRCGGQVGSLLELLQGRLSDHVMGIVTDPHDGLFPSPKEIRFECSCPDWAGMCKHIAAVLYGVGARLDREPELLFRLRGVDHTELVCEQAAQEVATRRSAGARTLDEAALADVFGIEIGTGRKPQAPRPAAAAAAKSAASAGRKVAPKLKGRKTAAVKPPSPAPSKAKSAASAKAKIAAPAKAEAAAPRKKKIAGKSRRPAAAPAKEPEQPRSPGNKKVGHGRTR